MTLKRQGSSQGTKAYCECKQKDAFRPLPGIESNIFVHSVCGLPTQPVWSSFIKRCPCCYKNFSSPIELVCLRCHLELVKYNERPQRIWLGWKWASKLTYSFVCLETSIEGCSQLLSQAIEQGRSLVSAGLLAEGHGLTGAESWQTRGIEGENLDLTFSFGN